MPQDDLGLVVNDIVSLTKSGTGAPGTVDTYTFTLRSGKTFSFQVTNGANGSTGGVEKHEFTTVSNFTDWYLTIDLSMLISVAFFDADYNSMLCYIDNGGSNTKLYKMLPNGNMQELTALSSGEKIVAFYKIDETQEFVPTTREIAGIGLGSNIPTNAIFDKTNIKGRYATLSDLQTADPNHGYCYLVEENNHWYYYNGSAWTDGGIYFTDLSDDDLKKAVGFNPTPVWTDNYTIGPDGDPISISGYSYATFPVMYGMKVFGYTRANGMYYCLTFYDANNLFIEDHYNTSGYDWNYEFAVPENARYVKITCQSSYKSSFQFHYGDLSNTALKLLNYYLKNVEDEVKDFENSLTGFVEQEVESEEGLFDANAKTIVTTYGGLTASVSVSYGEVYKVYAYRYNNQFNAIALLDASNNIVSLPVELSNGWNNVEITIPPNAVSMKLNGYSSTAPTLQKLVQVVSGEEIQELQEDIAELQANEDLIEFDRQQKMLSLNNMDKKNIFAWKPFDKAYFSWMNDDLRADAADYKALCDEFGFPYANAVPWTTLKNDTAIIGGVKASVFCKQIIQDGGEIFAHAGEPLTSSSTEQDFINMFVIGKKTIEEKLGSKINGIIQAGGAGYSSVDYDKCQLYSLSYFEYSDAYGTTPQYTLARSAIYDSEYQTEAAEVQAFKDAIDDAIANHKWLRFFCHAETSISVLRQVFQYIVSKGNLIEVVTWKHMYDTFRSSQLEQRIANLEE